MSLLQPYFYHDFTLEALRRFPDYGAQPEVIERDEGLHGRPGFRFTLELDAGAPTKLFVSCPQRMLMIRPGVPLSPLKLCVDHTESLQKQFESLYARDSQTAFGILPGFYTQRSDHGAHELVVGCPDEVTHALILAIGENAHLRNPQEFASEQGYTYLGVLTGDRPMVVATPDDSLREGAVEHWLAPITLLGDRLKNHIDAANKATEAQIYAYWQQYEIDRPYYEETMRCLIPALKLMEYQIEDHTHFLRLPAQPRTSNEVYDLWFQKIDCRLLTALLQCPNVELARELCYTTHTIGRNMIKPPQII